MHLLGCSVSGAAWIGWLSDWLLDWKLRTTHFNLIVASYNSKLYVLTRTRYIPCVWRFVYWPVDVIFVTNVIGIMLLSGATDPLLFCWHHHACIRTHHSLRTVQIVPGGDALSCMLSYSNRRDRTSYLLSFLLTGTVLYIDSLRGQLLLNRDIIHSSLLHLMLSHSHAHGLSG